MAIAAPKTPIAGKGPKPNIRIGSSMMFNISPTERIFKGVLVSPHPVKSDAVTNEPKIRGTPRNIVLIYNEAPSSTATATFIHLRRVGVIKNPIIPKIVPRNVIKRVTCAAE